MLYTYCCAAQAGRIISEKVEHFGVRMPTDITRIAEGWALKETDHLFRQQCALGDASRKAQAIHAKHNHCSPTTKRRLISLSTSHNGLVFLILILTLLTNEISDAASVDETSLDDDVGDLWQEDRVDGDRMNDRWAEEPPEPKVVLRPRTRMNLEEEAASAATYNSDEYDIPTSVPAHVPNQQPHQRHANPRAASPTLSTKRTASASATAAIPMARPVSKQQPTDTNQASAVKNDSVVKDDVVKHDFRPAKRSVYSAKDRARETQNNIEFVHWCRQVLGIETILEIARFPYNQTRIVSSRTTTRNWEDDIDPTTTDNDANNNTLYIRGLAASRDIVEGETVIRIPLQALLSVATTIDHDPVLSTVLGPSVRLEKGWHTPSNEQDVGERTDSANSTLDQNSHEYELPLLAVALLHHRRLGSSSPLSPYMDILSRATSDVENMPFMWSADRLRATASDEVRLVARGMRLEMAYMYDTVVLDLVETHPHIFAPAFATNEHGEWLFSRDNFNWAFCMANSRHWQLPIEDMEDNRGTAAASKDAKTPSQPVDHDTDNVPPAGTPTESWVLDQGDVDEEKPTGTTLPKAEHSFLAPMADLLNFGPPCTRVQYVASSRTFDIIATCALRKGAEVTFWYSNECRDVMMGVYGFTHPLMAPCPTPEEWRDKVEDLQEDVNEAQLYIEQLEEELDYMAELFTELTPQDTTTKDLSSQSEHRGHVRHEESLLSSDRAGSSSSGRGSRRRNRSDRGANSGRRIRRMWSRKTEF